MPCAANDSCETATEVDALPALLVGSNEYASAENPRTSVYSCGYLSSDSKTVWYKLRGSGTCVSVYMWASFSGVISVYRGSGCGSLFCESDYSDGEYYYDQAPRQVSFLAENETDYWILVGGSYGDAFGEFTLGIVVRDHGVTTDNAFVSPLSQETPDCASVPASPINDDCVNATEVDSLPYSVSASLAGATVDRGVFSSACSMLYPGDQRTVWYEVKPVQSTTCLLATIDLPTYGFTTVAVFAGSRCDGLYPCMGQQQGESRVSVSWKAEPQETYQLAIGKYDYRSGSDEFTLRIEVSTLPRLPAFSDTSVAHSRIGIPVH